MKPEQRMFEMKSHFEERTCISLFVQINRIMLTSPKRNKMQKHEGLNLFVLVIYIYI